MSKWPKSHRIQLQYVGTVNVKQERVDIRETGAPWRTPFLLNDHLSISWYLENPFWFNETKLFMEWSCWFIDQSRVIFIHSKRNGCSDDFLQCIPKKAMACDVTHEVVSNKKGTESLRYDKNLFNLPLERQTSNDTGCNHLVQISVLYAHLGRRNQQDRKSVV